MNTVKHCPRILGRYKTTLRHVIMCLGIVFYSASTATAQSLSVDNHDEWRPNKLDRVTVTLSGFSTTASSATVTMIGEWTAQLPADGPLCLAIRPASVDVPLSDGEGSAVWEFSNRFDAPYSRYHLQCRIRADDWMGTTADWRLHTLGGEHRITLDPAQVAAHATTSVEVAVWIDSGYSDGSRRPLIPLHWSLVPVVAGCNGVTPAQLDLEFEGNPVIGLRLLGTWDVMTTDPVECPVRLDSPDFEASATLSVVAPPPLRRPRRRCPAWAWRCCCCCCSASARIRYAPPHPDRGRRGYPRKFLILGVRA